MNIKIEFNTLFEARSALEASIIRQRNEMIECKKESSHTVPHLMFALNHTIDAYIEISNAIHMDPLFEKEEF